MRERQPNVQRHQAGLRAGSKQHQDQHQHGDVRRMLGRANRRKSVVSRRSRQQAEAQQQRQRAEACHHQVDVARLGVARFTMVRHDQRPGGERHEFPAQQIGKRVVRQHHEVHAGQEGGEEGQHAVRRRIVVAVAETIEAGRSASQIDDNQEK